MFAVQKAGPKFEATVRNKEKANPRFAFLLPWNQYHQYYRYAAGQGQEHQITRPLLHWLNCIAASIFAAHMSFHSR